MRQKTVRKLRHEAIQEMAKMGAASPAKQKAFQSITRNASNPYKNFIRNYRRENR